MRLALTFFTHVVPGVVMHRMFGAHAAILAFRHERNRLRDHFMLAAFLAVFGFPSTLLQPTFDDGPIPFAQVLSAMFRLPAEHYDIDKTHLFLQVFTLFKPTAHRQAETRHRRPIRRVPKLRVPGEIPHQDDFIKPGHRQTPVLRLRSDAAPPTVFRGAPSET